MDIIKTTTIKITTSDNKLFEVTSKVGHIINLIKDIIIDFDTSESIKLDKISSEQFQKVLNFCELVKYEPIIIENKHRIIPAEFKSDWSKPVLEYYHNLTQEEIVDLLTISDFLSIPSLDNICIIKLVETFRDEEKIKKFLKTDSFNFKIDKERELYLREKYKKDYSLDDLSEEEVKEMLDSFDKDYNMN